MLERGGARLRAWMLTLLVALVAALAVVGCGDSDDGGSSSGGSSTNAAASSDEFIIMLNGPLSDPTFGPMKKGADDAAANLGVRYQYSAPADVRNFVPDYTTLIRQAIGRRPDAIVIGNFIPSAFDRLIREAVGKGIPVVVVNTGLESWRRDGAIGYVGFSYTAFGEAAGDAAVKAGVRHLLCVNTAPVNPNLAVACNGARDRLEAAGGTSEMMNVQLNDATNKSALTQAIQGVLSSNDEIDGVQTLGAGFAPVVRDAIERAGKTGRVQIGGAALSRGDLEAIKSGDVSWLVDAQTYLQGYYGLQIASQYARYRLRPTKEIETGGLVVDRGNVDDLLTVQETYPGVLGAN